MDVLRNANEAEARGQSVIHMEVGQPSAPAPAPVLREARLWLEKGRLGYTDALGIDALRKRIARHYGEKYGVEIGSGRIAVTTGSSGGFNLAFLAAFDKGDRIGLATPGYPAYRNILKALGLEVVEIPTAAKDRWMLTRAAIEAAHTVHGLKGVLVASPANPSGTMLSPEALKEVCEACDDFGIRFISDEIYHGLVFSGKEETAAAYSENAIIVNSFSKYYCMTGWRVGWMVLPENLVRPVERLAQNLFISVPELSQRAAAMAFSQDAYEELEAVKAGYAKNRELIAHTLPRIGLDRFLPVDGAFYFYVDFGKFTNDTLDFSNRMLRETGVAATPGADFDPVEGHRYIRFSFAGAYEQIGQAMDRLGPWLAKL